MNYDSLKQVQHSDDEERTASVRTLKGRVADIDPADVDAILVAVKGRKEDANGEVEFKLLAMGSADLLQGLIMQATTHLRDRMPGFREEMLKTILAAALGADDEEDEGEEQRH